MIFSVTTVSGGSQPLNFNVERPVTILSPKGKWHVPVLLVEFEDKRFTYREKEYYYNLLFSEEGKSMRTYYKEVSYNKFEVDGDIIGPVLLDKNYTYYVGNGYGYESFYPQNSQGLLTDAVHAVDSSVDFSLYDNDHDGEVEVIFIIHPGKGAEETQDKADIWSHMWSLSDTTSGSPGAFLTDNVRINMYTIQPELLNAHLVTVGVFCHEFGHILGCPDLYEIKESGSGPGIGSFELMASGSWNGSEDMPGTSPAHFSVWCKYLLGWISPEAVEEKNDSGIQGVLKPIELYQSAYRILQNPYGNDWSFSGSGRGEYFLVEYRKRTGFDAFLPGNGLLIFHIDEAQSGNYYENHPLVGLLQADGDPSFFVGADRGSSTDMWQQGNITSYTLPSTILYNGEYSGAFIKDISVQDSFASLNLGIENLLVKGVYSFPNPYVKNASSDLVKFSYVSEKAETPYFTVTIYNIAGERIRTLKTEGTEVFPSQRIALWNGKNAQNIEVGTGVYLYLFKVPEKGITMKGYLTVIK